MRCGVPASQVKNVIIWGNHSSTQYPDVHHCVVNMSGSEFTCFDAVKDDAWLKGDFIAVSYKKVSYYYYLEIDMHVVFAHKHCSSKVLAR